MNKLNEEKKLFIFDFDGTLVTRDMLDEVCNIVNKKEESELINKNVSSGKIKGLEYLCTRINFLAGLNLKEIDNYLEKNNYLRKGTIELFDYLKKNNFITVIASGNIMPILTWYKKLLGVDYIVGTNIKVKENILQEVKIADFKDKDFKYNSCLEIIEKMNIPKENIYAIGDSVVDKKMLSLAGNTFAVDPKGGIEKDVQVIIEHDLSEVINYL